MNLSTEPLSHAVSFAVSTEAFYHSHAKELGRLLEATRPRAVALGSTRREWD